MQVARHLLDERHELCQPLSLEPGGSLPTLEPAATVARSARVARAICASLIGTRSSSPIRRSARAIVGAERCDVIARSARRAVEVADHEPREHRGASATPRRSRARSRRRRARSRRRSHPFAGPLMRRQSERSSTARSSPSGSQKPARISISMVPGYDRPPAIRPGSAAPSTLRAACVIPATSVPIPKSPGEIGVYSALGPEGIPAKRMFPTWRRVRT